MEEQVKKFSEVDLYGLLGVPFDASKLIIRQAYRKKALTCHPDKNPDNPDAAKMFHELSQALEVLIDEKTRKLYDRMLNAKKAAQLRTQQMDNKRQELKRELELKERLYQHELLTKAYNPLKKTAAQIYQEEFERLRKDGENLIKREEEIMRLRQLRHPDKPLWDSAKHRIKIKWKAEKDDPNNGGYSQESLTKYLSKYGEIVILVMSPKNPGSALVEFKTQDGAEMAMQYEKGDLSNPISLKWINGAPGPGGFPKGANLTDRDYESLVMRQLRQAEERKRLVEKLNNQKCGCPDSDCED